VWDFYLDTLEKIAPARNECCTAIAKFSLSKRFRELRGNLSPDALWSVCQSEFENWMQQQLSFEMRPETNSNLWPNVLRTNSAAIALAHGQVDSNELKLRTLVSRRNDIAHGKKMLIESLQEYEKYEHAALLVMHELAISVLEGLENKGYLK